MKNKLLSSYILKTPAFKDCFKFPTNYAESALFVLVDYKCKATTVICNNSWSEVNVFTKIQGVQNINTTIQMKLSKTI